MTYFAQILTWLKYTKKRAVDNKPQRDTMGRYSDLAGTQLVAETDYTFDLNGRLTDLDHSNGTGTIANYDYSYDINNRITEFASPEGVSIYNYDDTDQLTEADHNYQVDVYLR